jgi:hypothetical protein
MSGGTGPHGIRNAMEPRRDTKRTLPPLGALGVSLAIHLLLVFLGSFVWRDGRAVVLEVPPEPSEITFSFVETHEADARRSAVPPAPIEPLRVSPPPAGGVTPSPSPPAAIPPGRGEPTQPPPAEAAALEPPLPEAAPSEPGPDTRGLEPDDTGDVAPAGPDARPPTAAGTTPTTSVSQALRRFGAGRVRPPAEQRSDSGSSTSNEFVPDLSGLPASGFGMGNLTFESSDYDWTDYGRQIYMAIWRAWHQRLWMTTDDFEKWSHRSAQWALNHQTQVRFVIEQNGQVTGIVQEGTSGCDPLDVSALDALAEVILPPLPADFPRGSEIVHARFIAIGDVRSMRPGLGRMKAQGLF